MIRQHLMANKNRTLPLSHDSALVFRWKSLFDGCPLISGKAKRLNSCFAALSIGGCDSRDQSDRQTPTLREFNKRHLRMINVLRRKSAVLDFSIVSNKKPRQSVIQMTEAA